ncbi:hypothetical protein FXN63_11475 [Pigmentiphaga aceris]|uniref:Uncharacterized protein n=1 Tax=Pigmentiphaga aceris TaxID=1940612 RepID=A0A5C0AVC2_9BURK|nr:hypothetical protein [Pigmentiphaga aceris]QEI06382.1 hypothetical protein FXN63_11475 [Pigmentiphaga aceris]
MTATVNIQTSRVAAVDAQGQQVSVECQTVLVQRPGKEDETSRRYHYDHSHVREQANGVLVVLATGEELRLSPQTGQNLTPAG